MSTQKIAVKVTITFKDKNEKRFKKGSSHFVDKKFLTENSKNLREMKARKCEVLEEFYVGKIKMEKGAIKKFGDGIYEKHMEKLKETKWRALDETTRLRKKNYISSIK